MILQLEKIKLLSRFDLIFSIILRLSIFFYRFLHKEQAQIMLDP